MTGLDYLCGVRDGIDAAIEALSGRPRPAFAPPLPRTAARFEDTATMTWGLQAIGVTSPSALTGRGVRVAVLDTGIDLGHADFAGRIQANNTRSFVEGQAVQDGNGHGTHCCGTIAGPLTSVAGRRYGVAPNVELFVGKVLSNQGSGFDDQIIAGIEWAATSGARVISMSLGSARGVGDAFSPLYERVAERLLRENPGVLLIAAAGNDSNRPFFTRPVGNPAACPSIMGVAAVDADLRIAPFSNGRWTASAGSTFPAPASRFTPLFRAASTGSAGPRWRRPISPASPHWTWRRHRRRRPAKSGTGCCAGRKRWAIRPTSVPVWCGSRQPEPAPPAFEAAKRRTRVQDWQRASNCRSRRGATPMGSDTIKVHVGLSRELQVRLMAEGPTAVVEFATTTLKLSNVRQERLVRFGILVGEAAEPQIEAIRCVPGVDFVECDSAKRAI